MKNQSRQQLESAVPPAVLTSGTVDTDSGCRASRSQLPASALSVSNDPVQQALPYQPLADTGIVELHEDGKALGVEIERTELRQDEAQIENPFDPEKVKVLRGNKTIDLLCKRIDYDEIDLAPEFQRRARIWDQGRKSRLIESVLLRIPLPVFYVASDEKDRWSVVDGLQRMTTIHDFVKDVFNLRGLQYLVQFEKSLFSDLPRGMQRRIEETELVMNVIQYGTPEEVTFNIFSRINTGGMTLNAQEIRHALNKGPVREFLLELATMDEFTKSTTGSVNDKRMSARECALRFSAFYLKDWREYTNNDLDGFLNSTMKKISAMGAEERAELKSSFGKAMTVSTMVFGDDAFRKRYSLGAPRNPISKPLFETWALVFSKLNDEEIKLLAKRRKAVCRRFIETLCNDRDYEVSISYGTGTPARVRKRFATAENIVKEVLDNG